MKLINRRSVIMVLTKQMSDGTNYRNEIVEQCIGAIMRLKVHDSKERKTGKWIHLLGKDHCSNCGHVPVLDTEKGSVYHSPYCPNCGLEMEVEE